MTTIDWQGRTFLDITRQLRAMCGAPSTLEGHWNRAAFDTLLGGAPVDPPVAILEALTEPSRAWDMEPWPPERRAERAQSLFDCHLLAIALGHRPWLQTLHALWEHPEGNPDWQPLCQGQIDLALHGVAAGWDEDTLAGLREDRLLDEARPEHRAWMELARGDLRAAAEATEMLRRAIAAERARWPTTTGAEALQLLGRPGTILALELRALEALVAAHRR